MPGKIWWWLPIPEGRRAYRLSRVHENECHRNFRVKRFWDSEALTKEVIRNGVEAAKPWQDCNRITLEEAVCQQTDWLIGINLTHYMISGNNTLKVQGIWFKWLNRRSQLRIYN
jgi:hypothetical protein